MRCAPSKAACWAICSMPWTCAATGSTRTTSGITMPTTAATRRGNRGAHTLRSAGTFLLYAALLWPAVSGGAHAGWPLAATQLLVLLALLAWTLALAPRGRLEWRRTALDLPVRLPLRLIL